MGYRLSQHSRSELVNCDKRLQDLVERAIVLTPMDFMVLQGWRSVNEQMKLFQQGRSKIDGITKKSKHNYSPSLAVDLVPYPIDWTDLERFRFLGGFILGIASSMGIPLRWGGDWDGDGSFKDQTFNDLPHFELIDNVV